ncbi:hypothetical protein QZH41_005016 [Actinostola sp. cb2023]|nr:hypothetical protein QZH41_005016 [Actinostola sp. cb2023]
MTGIVGDEEFKLHETTICQSNNPCKNDGECIASTGPYKYQCTCTNGFAGRNCEKKCILYDFESGRLDGWTLTGTAFDNQPTYGDNPKARGRPMSNLKGNWFIATFENRPSPSHPVAFQGDIPTGTATSPPFLIKGTTLKFLIGGGADTNLLRVELLIRGSAIYSATSDYNTETMVQKTFDVTNYREQTAQIRIVDESSGVYGMIKADHFEDSICAE